MKLTDKSYFKEYFDFLEDEDKDKYFDNSPEFLGHLQKELESGENNNETLVLHRRR